MPDAGRGARGAFDDLFARHRDPSGRCSTATVDGVRFAAGSFVDALVLLLRAARSWRCEPTNIGTAMIIVRRTRRRLRSSTA
jgi:hypothetical protein